MPLKKLTQQTLLYGGGDLAGKVLAFFTFPLIAAALLPRAFGALDLIMTTVSLAGLFVNCGLNNAVQRFYWDADTDTARRPLIVSSGLFVLLLFGCAAVAAGLALSPLLLAQARRAGLPFGPIAIVSALSLLVIGQVTQYIQDVTRLHFAPLKFLTLSLIGRVLTALLGVAAVVHFHLGIDGLLATQALAGLAIIPLGLYMVRSDLTWRFDKAWARQLLAFGHPFIFMGLAYWLFGSMDRWMLSVMSSVTETGIYSVGFRFASVVLFVAGAFGQAWSPYAIKLKADHPETYKVLYARVFLFLLYAMLVVGGGIALFSGELIGLFMPASYAGSAAPLAILSFGVILQATQQVTAIGISLEKKTYIFSRLAWVTALLNFVGNLYLVPRYGAVGSAWATCLSYLVLTGSYLFYSQRLHPLPLPWRRLCVLLGLGACVFAVALVFNTVVFQWQRVAIKLLFACLCMALGGLVLPAGKVKHDVAA